MHRITVPLPSGLHFVTAERVINSAHEQNVNIRHEDILQHVCLLYHDIVKLRLQNRQVHVFHATHISCATSTAAEKHQAYTAAQTLPHADKPQLSSDDLYSHLYRTRNVVPRALLRCSPNFSHEYLNLPTVIQNSYVERDRSTIT